MWLLKMVTSTLSGMFGTQQLKNKSMLRLVSQELSSSNMGSLTSQELGSSKIQPTMLPPNLQNKAMTSGLEIAEVQQIHSVTWTSLLRTTPTGTTHSTKWANMTCLLTWITFWMLPVPPKLFTADIRRAQHSFGFQILSTVISVPKLRKWLHLPQLCILHTRAAHWLGFALQQVSTR